MLKISDAVRDIVFNNFFLQFGLHHKLLNLSQLSRFIQPLIEARTKKEVQPSAILMSLSRLGSEAEDTTPDINQFEIEHISVYSNLCTVTHYNTHDMHKNVNALYNRIQKQGGFITISEGKNEITVITEKKYTELIKKLLVEKPYYENDRVAAVSVSFDPRYLKQPGLLYLILQQVALQNVNIIEIASTATEFILYLAEEDVRLAFDTIYNSFHLSSSNTE